MASNENPPTSARESGPEMVYASITCTRPEKELWTEEAEENRYSSRAKYLRAMVHAGRREFGIAEEDQSRPERTVTDLKSRVRANLSTQEPTEFDDLVEIITAEIEDEIETCLEELVEEEKVKFQPRGGIVKTD